MMTIFIASSEAALDRNISSNETNKYPYSTYYGTSINPLEPQNDLQRQNEDFEKQRQEQQKQFDEKLERQQQEIKQYKKELAEKREQWRQKNELDMEQLLQDYEPPQINSTVPNQPNEQLQKNNFDEDKSTYTKDNNNKFQNTVSKEMLPKPILKDETLPEPTLKDKISHFLASSNFNFFILGIIFSIVSLLVYKLINDITFRHNTFAILKGVSAYLGLSLASYIIIPIIIIIVLAPFVLDLFLAKYIYDFFYDLIGISFFASIPAIIIFSIIAIPLIILMAYFFTNN